MAKRKQLSKKASSKLYKKYTGTHKKNMIHRPILRGGIRL